MGMLGLGDGTDGDVVAQYGDVQWCMVWGCEKKHPALFTNII